MDVPSLFHHAPVGLVAVHGDLHTAAAGSDAYIKGSILQLGNGVLQLIHIFQGGSSGNVTAVQQDMYPDLADAFSLGFLQHGQQVADVAVYVAVAQQADKVQRTAGSLDSGNQFLPGIGSIDAAAFNGFVDQFGTLGVDLAAAQCVVADFAVAHVVV